MTTYLYDDNKPIKVTLDTTKITGKTFMKNGVLWEKKQINYFYSKVPKDKQVTIVDIGAQSGLYTLYAKYLPNSHFYAFEPYKVAYNLLTDNIKLNKINNVKTFNLAVSDKKEETVLNVNPSQPGLNTMGKKVTRFSNPKKETIQTVTLDEMFYDKEIPVDFIKIDTEGWEYYILKGGEKTIRKYEPYIQLEICGMNLRQTGVTENQLRSYLSSLGYTQETRMGEEYFFSPKNLKL